VTQGDPYPDPLDLDAFKAQVFTRARASTGELKSHLEDRYGVAIRALTELDVGVFRVDLLDGPIWVARVFPAVRPLEQVQGDADILRDLAGLGFPAERGAHAEAVSTLAGQGVLVTEHVPGSPAKRGPKTLAMVGNLLGRLHTLPATGAMSRPGGSWHHLSLRGGDRRDDVDALTDLLARTQGPDDQLDLLRREVAAIDDGHDLPQAFIHPDFTPPNIIIGTDSRPVVIDWAGAGLGPRVAPLGFLLWAAGLRDLDLVDAVVAGYRTQVELTGEELDRLAKAVRAPSLIIEAWSVAVGRTTVADVVGQLAGQRAQAEAIAARARAAFGGAPPAVPASASQILHDAVVGKSDEEIAAFAASAGDGYEALCDQVFQRVAVARQFDDCHIGFVLGESLTWSFRVIAGKVTISRRASKRAGATVTVGPADFLRLITREMTVGDAIDQGRLVVEDDVAQVERFFQAKPPGAVEVAAPPAPRATPLWALLSQPLVAFIIEFDNEFERRMPHRTTNHGRTAATPWLVSMVMWTNCMQYVPDDGVVMHELAPRARLTNESMDLLVKRMGEWWGYLSVAPDPADRRPKPPRSGWLVHPTAAGRQAQSVWRPLTAEIEQRWRDRLGDALDDLRGALQTVTDLLALPLPELLPVGTPRLERAERAERAGSEWSLPALLSQVLLAFSLEYGRETLLPLGVVGNVLRVLDEVGIPVRDLPRLSGVSKEAVNAVMGDLEKKRLVDFVTDDTSGRGARARLTARGHEAREAAFRRGAEVEQHWQKRFGPDAIAALRSTLEPLVGGGSATTSALFAGLTPYPEGWRAAIPARETLPHYPLMSHRGGFPDGS